MFPIILSLNFVCCCCTINFWHLLYNKCWISGTPINVYRTLFWKTNDKIHINHPNVLYKAKKNIYINFFAVLKSFSSFCSIYVKHMADKMKIFIALAFNKIIRPLLTDEDGKQLPTWHWGWLLVPSTAPPLMDGDGYCLSLPTLRRNDLNVSLDKLHTHTQKDTDELQTHKVISDSQWSRVTICKSLAPPGAIPRLFICKGNTTISHNIKTTWPILPNTDKTALTRSRHGLHRTSEGVCCGNWHQDVSSRSLKWMDRGQNCYKSVATQPHRQNCDKLSLVVHFW